MVLERVKTQFSISDRLVYAKKQYQQRKLLFYVMTIFT